MEHERNVGPYPKWAGLVLGLLLGGSAHVLAGREGAGILWYLAIVLSGVAAAIVLAVPGATALAASALLAVVSLLLWMVMLKQSYRPVRRIGPWGWVAVLALGVLSNAGWRFGASRMAHAFRVPSSAMAPAILPGDCVMADRVTYWFSKPQRGDVVVFSSGALVHPGVGPDALHVKRIAGLPGETVRIVPPNLLVDGQPVLDPAVFAAIAARPGGFLFVRDAPGTPAVLSSAADQVVLGDDEYFVLGDNTASSLDSRYYGPISREQILGRITRVYWPPSRGRP